MTLFFPDKNDLEEIKKVPAFCRICIDNTFVDKGYAIILKANTTELSYLIIKDHLTFTVVFVQPQNTLAYFIEIQDGYDNPARVWSVISSEHEIKGISGIKNADLNAVYIFNETGACVGCGQVTEIKQLQYSLPDIFQSKFSFNDRFKIANRRVFSDYFDKADRGDARVARFKISISWTENQISYVGNDLSVKDLSINALAGIRQEGISQIISDGLSDSFVKSSLRSVSDPTNEITDIFANTGKHAVLLESKELAVVSEDLVSGKKSEKRTARSIRKAMKQLRGAVKYIYNHSEAYDWKNDKIGLGNWEHSWAIIVVSDIRRIPVEHNDIISELENFEKETQTIINVMDTNLLFRAVQYANIIAEEENDLNIGDHFVAWLLQRRLMVDRCRNLRFDILYQGNGMFEAHIYS